MEKINVAELLKNCPKGMELDCVMYDGLEFDRVDERSRSNYSIVCRVKTESGQYNFHTFTKYGSYTRESYSKCVIFPKGKTTWEGFQKPFKDGDIVATTSGAWVGITLGGNVGAYIPIYCVIDDDNEFMAYIGRKIKWAFSRLATEEEKEKLFKAIKDNGYKWNAETKTLEKLVNPKFKVGDRIRDKKYHTEYSIINIENDKYVIKQCNNNFICRISVKCIDADSELIPNKFDITTLKPFESKVLVRTEKRKWVTAFYSHYDKDSLLHHCVVGGLWYKQCIPYNDETKHLLDTTDDCCDYYKTWE